jgi:hypothetical protein
LKVKRLLTCLEKREKTIRDQELKIKSKDEELKKNNQIVALIHTISQRGSSASSSIARANVALISAGSGLNMSPSDNVSGGDNLNDP